MSHFLDDIELTANMTWQNEFDESGVGQTLTRSQIGHLIVQSQQKTSYLKFKLVLESEWFGVDRQKVKSLKTKAAENVKMILKLDDLREFNVRFDYENSPIVATPLIDFSEKINSDHYALTLNFIEVD